MARKEERRKGIVATSAFHKFLLEQYTQSRKNYNQYSNIEHIAKEYGLYSFEELHKLIKKHSPIKNTRSFYVCKIIYDVQKKNKNKSFHAICVDNLQNLSILIGIDPTKIDYGKSWIKNQQKKGKTIPANLKLYTEIIKTLGLIWKRLFVEKNKTFMGWYNEQTKASTEQMLQFLGRTYRYLQKKKSK